MPLFYCPWCGSKLPKRLGKEWGEVLEKEYGIDAGNVFAKEWKKLPKELKTDKWWKDRGL